MSRTILYDVQWVDMTHGHYQPKWEVVEWDEEGGSVYDLLAQRPGVFKLAVLRCIPITEERGNVT